MKRKYFGVRKYFRLCPLSHPLSLDTHQLPAQAGLRWEGEEEGGGGEDPGGEPGHQEAEDGPLQVQVHHAQKRHQGMIGYKDKNENSTLIQG